MRWADEPEQDRALVERGASVFLRVLTGVAVLALYAVAVAIPGVS